jgi:hypothetical protein
MEVGKFDPTCGQMEKSQKQEMKRKQQQKLLAWARKTVLGEQQKEPRGKQKVRHGSW